MFNKVLVVCVGNICRSPMVEAEFKHSLKESSSITVTSAGLAALVGQPVDPMVKDLLEEKNINCAFHKARQLTSVMLLEADLVLVMENYQCKQIECKFPSVCGKVHLLGKWGAFEVPDPYRKSKEFFKETHQLIVQGIAQWQAKLWN